ncbi:hypothetical protein F5Y09DRAFT_335225 [Xylaria sp. FL1042]|nr:hypothetical protein F5Y09DRAFT_335225 [Xylaria sp. FL1042]
MALANLFASLTPLQQELILDGPALPPPPGVKPKLDYPPNANYIVYPTIIFALILSSTFVILRVHGRFYCMKTVKRSLILIHLYAGIMLLLKTAILTEWLQTFSPPGNHGPFYWTCIVTMTLNALFWTIGILVIDFQCIPFAAIYNKTVPGHCLPNMRILDVFANAFNLATDLIILALPQGVIWNLRMSSLRRLGLSFVFAVGLL